METLTSLIPYSKEDRGLEFTVVLGRSPIGLGDPVRYKHRDRLIGERYVSFRRVIRLSNVTDEDLQLLPKGYRYKTQLWSKLEKAYGHTIPSHYEISIIGLSKQYSYWDEPMGDTGYDPFFEWQEESDEPLPYEEYDDEYGNLPRSERIKGHRDEEW